MIRQIVPISAVLLFVPFLVTVNDAQSDAPTPPQFANDVERHRWITETLMPWMETFRSRYHNVPRSDGQFLQWLILARKAKRALEIGTANGYSALWLGAALESTGGRLTTVEINPQIVKEARMNLTRAGMLDKVVTVIEGDALKVVPKLKGRFDFVFIDIGPKSLPFFESLHNKLDKDAIVAVHHPPFEGALREYLEAIRAQPEWQTTIVQTGAPTSIVLSLRK
jgi:predicted O-methyltransferase YrrM